MNFSLDANMSGFCSDSHIHTAIDSCIVTMDSTLEVNHKLLLPWLGHFIDSLVWMYPCGNIDICIKIFEIYKTLQWSKLIS